MKTIKGKEQAITILMLSVVVQVDDIEKFAKYTSRLTQREFMKHIVASVNNRLT